MGKNKCWELSERAWDVEITGDWPKSDKMTVALCMFPCLFSNELINFYFQDRDGDAADKERLKWCVAFLLKFADWHFEGVERRVFMGILFTMCEDHDLIIEFPMRSARERAAAEEQ